MAKQVQLRRGTTAELSSVTGAIGEVIVDTTKDTLTVHDGYTAGGTPLLKEDLSNLANNSVGLGKIATGTHGQILYYNASGQLTTLAPGSSGQLLKTNGSGQNPSWESKGEVKNYEYSSMWRTENINGAWVSGPGFLGDGTMYITPKAAGNRLLITTTMQMGQVDTWHSSGFIPQYQIGGTGGSWSSMGGSVITTYISGRNGGANSASTVTMLSLNTTSTVYFRVLFRSQNSGDYVRLNYGGYSNADNLREYNQVSTVTIQEIV